MNSTNPLNSLLDLALRALRNSSAVVFQDPSQSALRDEALVALQAAVDNGCSVVPGGHVAVPLELDEGFAKAVAVVHTLDEDEWGYATEAWGLLIQEALQRQALREAGRDPVREAARRVIELPFESLSAEQHEALVALADSLGVQVEIPG